MTDYTKEVRKTTDLLTAAEVAVYPVDARKLVNDPAGGADQQLDDDQQEYRGASCDHGREVSAEEGRRTAGHGSGGRGDGRSCLSTTPTT